MARTIPFRSKYYSDAAYVEGVARHNPIKERELDRHCRNYFYKYCRSIFFRNEETLKDIYQEAFVILWNKIELHRIYAEDGKVKNINGKDQQNNTTPQEKTL